MVCLEFDCFSVFLLVSSPINFNKRTFLMSFLLKTNFLTSSLLAVSPLLNYCQIFFQIIQINFSNFIKIFFISHYKYHNIFEIHLMVHLYFLGFTPCILNIYSLISCSVFQNVHAVYLGFENTVSFSVCAL